MAERRSFLAMAMVMGGIGVVVGAYVMWGMLTNVLGK